MVVYHGTNVKNISIFDRTRMSEEQTLVGTGTATFGNFFSDKKDDAESFAAVTRLRRKSGKATVYDVFLNIKNPIYFETLSDFRNYSSKKGHYNENGDFVSDVKLPEEYDGVIVKRRNSSDDSKEFVAPSSNQIKSATDNTGAFSTTNDDIYDNISKLISEKDASVNQTSTETITPTETKEVEVKEVTVADNNEPTMDLNTGLNIGKVRDRRKKKSGTKVNPKPTRLIPSRLTWGVWEGFVNDDSGPIDVDMSLKLLSKIYTEEQWNQLSDEEMEHELKCKGSFIAK